MEMTSATPRSFLSMNASWLFRLASSTSSSVSGFCEPFGLGSGPFDDPWHFGPFVAGLVCLYAFWLCSLAGRLCSVAGVPDSRYAACREASDSRIRSVQSWGCCPRELTFSVGREGLLSILAV